MKERRVRILLVLLGIPACLRGQEAETNLPLQGRRSLLRLESVGLFGGYYSSGSPVGLQSSVLSPFSGPTAILGSTMTVGGSRTAERSDFVWSYSPSYFKTVYSSQNIGNYGSLNHQISLNWRRKFGSKWTFTSSARGDLANLEQLYFAPGLLSSIAAFPTTFDNLSAALLTGKVTDAQFAAVLTGSALQAAPEQAFPYGSRLLSASANTTLSWAPSGRTTFSATLTGGRTQHVNGVGVTGTDRVPGSFLPQMTTAAGSISWSRSVSPRTQVGVQATTTRSFSTIQRGYASSTQFSVGRTMSRRWFAEARGGMGAIAYSRQQYGKPRTVQPIYGGSIGFKTISHTLLAGYDRALGDVYGFGSGATETVTAGWNWRRPGSNWAAMAGGSHQKLLNTKFSNTSSWRTSAGISRILGKALSMNCQAVYFQLPLDFTTAASQRDQTGVIFSLVWSARK